MERFAGAAIVMRNRLSPPANPEFVMSRRNPNRGLTLMRKGIAHLLGLLSVVVTTLLRPGPVVRWLSRRFPDVLFQQLTADSASP